MRRIHFYRHDLGEPEVEAFRTALAGPILTTGDVVAEFERRFAAALGAEHAVGVTSCTGALHLALVALGIGPGAEVITTPMTFIATATAILQAGARPVFVDVEPETGNIDVARIEAAITPRTRAVMPVHLFGQMCDMRALRALADRHRLAVIEDAAHCVEGARDGVRPGQLSEAACFSFYATKSLTSGEGGALVVRDARLADELRLLRLHGMTSSANERERSGYQPWDMVAMGWKYNMDNLQAAILLPQLERLRANWERRQALAARYVEQLRRIDRVSVPAVRDGVDHAWHLFVVWVDGVERNAVVAGLEREEVGVTVNYPPVHLTSWFRRAYGYRPGAFPAAERIGSAAITLPLYATMPPAHVDAVVERLARVLGRLPATSI
jgi:UDP-4-amino-4-deoxy-L-arabinose-oxoglutarate aminotransferase